MNTLEESTLLTLAHQYMNVRNSDLAKKTLLKILQKNPDSSKANELLAYLEGGTGNINVAIELLTIACAQKNCSSEALYNLGKYYVDSEEPLKGLSLLKKSISKNVHFFESHHYLGLAYAKGFDYENAINAFKKAVSVNPASTESLNNLNNCLTALHKNEDALPFILRACELEGGNAI
ncbi:lipopolysaccharide assembly protein LapB, partial [Polynucleobacter sp. JS-JIR-5-A7]|uniref:tetratricopeptide repeat protein n=1 Tax=Polynucleobacter sp. JS-JIR-5-A7 TaxID=1758395 RepID=UPI001BFDC7D1